MTPSPAATDATARGGGSNIFAAPGFGVLLGKELLEASRSKRMLIFLLIMTIAVALFPLIGYFRMDDLGDGARHTISRSSMEGLIVGVYGLIGYLGSLFMIASTVDAVSRERALGISAWIVTKPVSRTAYMLAKAMAHTIVGAVSIVIVPLIVWFVLMTLFFNDVPLTRPAIGMLILLLEVAFLSFLNISLGVPFRSVPPIAIVSLAFWFAPTFLPAIPALEWTFQVLPSYLPLVAAAVAAEVEFEKGFWLVPLCSALSGAIAFIVALVWFEQQEL